MNGSPYDQLANGSGGARYQGGYTYGGSFGTQGSLSTSASASPPVSSPAPILGAHEIVNYLFSGETPQQGLLAQLSPPGEEFRPRKADIGLPLSLATEPVNAQSRRLVYTARGQPPVSVRAEVKNRFLAISFKAPYPLDASTPTPTCFGTVLGYSDSNSDIIWHERADRFATQVPLASIRTIHRASALQCKHCGLVLLKPELRQHMSTHKRGSGLEFGVFTDDPTLGSLCGNTGLMQNLCNPRRLGEGAQGVVDAYDVIQPTQSEMAEVGPNSVVYDYRCRQFSPDKNLSQVVVKTMHFDDGTEALRQYQKSVRFLTIMDNPHVVEYLGVQLLPDQATVRLMMPCYTEGDLSNVIRDFRGDHFEESFVCSLALQLASGLAFLHERNPPIVHGDLKVENVMFYNKHQQVVLMDMDASAELGGNYSAVQTSLGTTAYMAPETLNNERLMPASDMWSLGVLLFVMSVLPEFPMILNPTTNNLALLNDKSWATPDDAEALFQFANQTNSIANPTRTTSMTQFPAMTLRDCVEMQVRRKGYSKDFTKLVCDLISYNPFKRPTAQQVMDRVTEIMTNSLLAV